MIYAVAYLSPWDSMHRVVVLCPTHMGMHPGYPWQEIRYFLNHTNGTTLINSVAGNARKTREELVDEFKNNVVRCADAKFGWDEE